MKGYIYDGDNEPLNLITSCGDGFSSTVPSWQGDGFGGHHEHQDGDETGDGCSGRGDGP